MSASMMTRPSACSVNSSAAVQPALTTTTTTISATVSVQHVAYPRPRSRHSWWHLQCSHWTRCTCPRNAHWPRLFPAIAHCCPATISSSISITTRWGHGQQLRRQVWHPLATAGSSSSSKEVPPPLSMSDGVQWRSSSSSRVYARVSCCPRDWSSATVRSVPGCMPRPLATAP